jgi:hypothetical protein
LREDHGAFGAAGNGGSEALKFTGRDDDLLAAQVLDETLLGAAVLADGLR